MAANSQANIDVLAIAGALTGGSLAATGTGRRTKHHNWRDSCHVTNNSIIDTQQAGIEISAIDNSAIQADAVGGTLAISSGQQGSARFLLAFRWQKIPSRIQSGHIASPLAYDPLKEIPQSPPTTRHLSIL